LQFCGLVTPFAHWYGAVPSAREPEMKRSTLSFAVVYATFGSLGIAACSSGPANDETASLAPSPARAKVKPQYSCGQCYTECESPWEGCMRDVSNEWWSCAQPCWDCGNNCLHECLAPCSAAAADGESWCGSAVEECYYSRCYECTGS
jgi:hypothetical protein